MGISRRFVFLSAFFLFFLLPAARPFAGTDPAPDPGKGPDAAGSGSAKVEFSVKPLSGAEVRKGEDARFTFTLTGVPSDPQKVSPRPAVWAFLRKDTGMRKSSDNSCKETAAVFSKVKTGFRADIDLARYFILTLNDDASVSVLDPMGGVQSITRLYAMVPLEKPGADWAMSAERRKLFITIPAADRVAVVDTDSFKITATIRSMPSPSRIALQPDGKYLWVGNDSGIEGESGVTVVDPERNIVAARIPTGAGHHEIAFSDDSLFVFVLNRGEGTLSVIDIEKMKKVKDLTIGKSPSSVAFSRAGNAIYAVDETDGKVTIVDAATHEIAGSIGTAPGPAVLRFAPGGRWGLLVNTRESLLSVIDAEKKRVIHTVQTGRQPDQIAFTKEVAYLRSKRSGDTSLIRLSELGAENAPVPHTLPGEPNSPGESLPVSYADALFPGPEGDVMLSVDASGRSISYYRDGLQSPLGNLLTYGRAPRALIVADRGLRETGNGIYTATAKIPEEGRYHVVFSLGTPESARCFEFTAQPNPLLPGKKGKTALKIEFMNKERRVKAGEAEKLRFRLTDTAPDSPAAPLNEFIALATLAPGQWQKQYPVKSVGEGIYEMDVTLPRPGMYYLYFSVPSLKISYNQLPFFIVHAEAQAGNPPIR